MQRSILRQRINARLFSTATMLRALANKMFIEHGFEVTPEQYLILSLVADNKKLYQRQLSEITLKDRANITRIIKILEKKGLITKTSESNGRQIFMIEPTQKGIETHNTIKVVTKKNKTDSNIGD